MDRNRFEMCVRRKEKTSRSSINELSTYMTISALFDGGWSMAVDDAVDVVGGEGAVAIIIIL